MKLNKSSFWSKIPNWVWLIISIGAAVLLWIFASNAWPLVIANPMKVWK